MLTSIESWERSVRGSSGDESDESNAREGEPEPGTPSSVLSSVGDRIADVEMELS